MENEKHIPAFDAEMAEILESFIVESHEILEKLGTDLLQLEKNPENTELHNVIFRAVHTLKGTSSFLGFEQLTEVAHKFEDVLNKIRRNELNVTSAMMDVLFEGFDLFKLLMEKIEVRDMERIDVSATMTKLQAAAKGESATLKEKIVEPEKPILSEQKIEPEHVAAETLHHSEPEHHKQEATAQNVQPRATAVDTTIRVDVSRLDALMNLVGELVLGRNRLAQIVHQMNSQYDAMPITRELAETNSHIDFITTELQMAVMKTRMVPVAKVFNKVPRLIRELSKEMNKEIELSIFGEETELDKSLIEELNDPLIHLIRNAADHGIESPSDRAQKGKPTKGTVILKAMHEGNHIVISIEDDGKGMDPEVLKNVAIQKGILTPQAAQEMSNEEAYKLIFAPGFSTAKKVTNVSGRGVGMDVVRTNISKLKGTIDIESEINKGSKFIIKLPLTLAIIQALLVESKKEIFCVPLESVIEVVRTTKSDIHTIHGHETILLRNAVLPLIHLSDVLYGAERNEQQESMYTVVVGIGNERLGIVVDALLGQKEIVIKSLGEYFGTLRGIAGSTILGDGRVIMIIDVAELMKMCVEIAEETAV